MATLECKHCGAPLSGAAASGPVTCPYCGTVNESTAALQRPPALSQDQQRQAFKEAIKEEIEERILHGRPGAGPPVPPVPVPVTPKSFGQSLRSCLTGCGCLLLLLGGAAVYGFLQDPGAAMRGIKQVLEGGLSPQDLRSLTSHDSVRLAVPPPPGGYAAFDPGRQLPWLLEQARGWAPDAHLRRLRVIRLHGNGSADLQGDDLALLDAEFDSPSATAKSLASHARSHNDLNTGLFLRIHKGQLAAKLEWGGAHQPDRPDLSNSVPLSQALANPKIPLGSQGTVLLNANLTYDTRAGWVWAFQSIHDAGALPRLRAANGSVIP